MLLMKQLTEMKSNYFIRAVNINKVAEFAGRYDEAARYKKYVEIKTQMLKALKQENEISCVDMLKNSELTKMGIILNKSGIPYIF